MDRDSIFNRRVSSFTRRLARLKNSGYYCYMRRLESASTCRLRVQDRDVLMFSTNNYLGFTTHPKVKEAALQATREFGVGAGSVRLLGGTYHLHEMLEERLAHLKGTEASITYSSGYSANIATISALMNKPDDIVLADEKTHASLIDGCRLSGVPLTLFKHNDMLDLELKLASSSQGNGTLIIADGVYSVDGDIALLPEIHRLARQRGAALLIDDAHATGVLGAHGRGTAEHFGLEGTVDIVMGTLSKALGGIGGFAAGSKPLVDYLKHCSRGFIFSTALPPAICAGALAALKLLESEPHWLDRLRANAVRLRSGLSQLGYRVGSSNTPIIPVLIGPEIKTYRLACALFELGVFVGHIIFPAAARNDGRLRVSTMATHTDEDIDRALDAFDKARRVAFP